MSWTLLAKMFLYEYQLGQKKIEIDFFLWALTISPILESLLPIVWFEVLKCYFRYSNTQTQSQKFKTCTLIKNVVHTNRVYFCELNKKSIFLANIIEYLAYNFQTKDIYLERILFLSRWNLPKYVSNFRYTFWRISNIQLKSTYYTRDVFFLSLILFLNFPISKKMM